MLPAGEFAYISSTSIVEIRGACLLSPNNAPYDNRIFRCLVISLARHAIREYGKESELLGAVRDVIKAHMSLYKGLDSSCNGASCWSGTVEFMAIEVLLSVGHTYRHDLEPFFYVLMW